MPREMRSPRTWSWILPQFPNYIPKDTNYTPNNLKKRNSPGITQVDPQKHLTWHHEDPSKVFSPIFNLLLYITLLTMVLTWPDIQ